MASRGTSYRPCGETRPRHDPIRTEPSFQGAGTADHERRELRHTCPDRNGPRLRQEEGVGQTKRSGESDEGRRWPEGKKRYEPERVPWEDVRAEHGDTRYQYYHSVHERHGTLPERD